MTDELTEADRQAAQAFVDQWIRRTTRLVRFTSEGKIGGIASGFIVRQQGRYFLISAGHAFWTGAEWFLEANYNLETASGGMASAEEVILIQLGPAQLVSAITLSDLEKLLAEEASKDEPATFSLPDVQGICPESKPGMPLDIAWVELDMEAIMKRAKDAGKYITLEVYPGPLDQEPSHEEAYGFASMSRVVDEHHELYNLRILAREAAYEVCMQFENIDEQHDLYCFSLAREHQGDKYYYGSSGSPIADLSGTIVAVVVCGSKASNSIFGFPLKRIAHLLHLE